MKNTNNLNLTSKTVSKFFAFILAASFTVVQSITAEEMGEDTDASTGYSYVKDKKETGYDDSEAFMEWHGYLNFEYDDVQGKNSNFDNHEFYLNVTANMSKRVKVTAEFEYEHTPEKIIAPIQAFADFQLLDDDLLYMRTGLWYIPIGLAPSYNLRGNGNKMIRQVAVIHDIEYENWAETGVDFWGVTNMSDNVELSYDFFVGNGVQGIGTGDSWFQKTDDLQSHSEDNNYDKLLGTHLGLNFENALGGNLGLGLSYVTQDYDNHDVTGEALNQTHIGFDLRYTNNSGYRIQAEYLKREGDDHATLANDKISVEADGWYFQTSKKFNLSANSSIEYVIQYDKIDLNKYTDTNDDKSTLSFGIIYTPENYVQFKFEYDSVSEDSGQEIDNDVVWFASVFQF